MLRAIRRAIRAFFRNRKIEKDLNDELQFHLDMQTQEYVRRGMTTDEARRAARRTFGGVQQIKEEVRDLRGVGMIEVLKQDVRFGVRTLLKNPAFTVVAVLTLALGIGANTAIFSVINGVVLRPLPYERGDRIVLINQQRPLANAPNQPFSVHEVEDYRSQNQTLSGVVEYHSMSFILLGRKDPERVQTGVVSHNFFEVMGVKPVIGRTFRESDEQHGADAVLMLSYGYWQRAFGGDPEVVGRVFQMNDRPHTVIGVLPHVPQYPDENDVYMPTSACPFRSADGFIANRNLRMMRVFGRMKDGVSLERVSSDLATIANRLQQDYPDSYPKSAGYRAIATSLEGELTGGIKPTLWMLISTAGFVLLIVCASVANLTVARLLRREREMTVRAAMGASRGRLLRQLVTESSLLSLAGGLCGLAFAAASMNMLITFASRFTTRAAEITMDGRVLLFTLAVSLLTGIIFGTLPALQPRRDIAGSLRETGGRGTASASRQRLRNGLIVAQVAVSFVLLIGAGLMIRSLLKLQAVDPGFNFRNVLTMRVDLNFSKYDTFVKRRDIAQRILTDFRNIPGVTAAAAAGTFPLNDQNPRNSRFVIEGRPIPEGALAPAVDVHIASPGYFETIGMRVLRGRTFSAMDHADAPPVAILNQSVAQHFWPNADPVGQRISLDGGQNWVTVVGVVADVRQRLETDTRDGIYYSLVQQPQLLTLQVLLRTSGDPKTLSSQVREALYKNDPEQPVDRFRTLEEVRAEALASPRLTTALLGLFAALALVITATGIAGVMGYAVSQRTHEIGIRMALGARRGEVLWMVLRHGVVLVGAGLAAGIAGSLVLSRNMNALLFGVQSNDLLTFAGVSVVLIAMAAAACLLPARRATAIDPVIALRSEA